MNQPWWKESVVYQIYPRSFQDTNGDGIGDINGIIKRLDYLQKLGIDVIWLSPVYQSPMDDNGYDISDYQKIAPEFGTLADMENLISEAAKHDIKIIMDLVVNHTSDEHPWFVESRKSKENPYRDYYIWRAPQENGEEPSDMKSIFGGSAWSYDEVTGEYYFHLFSKKQPDLNWDNEKVREEIHKMMNWWLDKKIGGFRMDVIDLLGKEIDQKITDNGPNLHKYIQEMNQATFGKWNVLTVGETWGATPEIAKLYSTPDRNELSMVFQFEHITAGWDEVHGKWRPKPFDLIEFKRIIKKWQTDLYDQAWNSLFWSNHDLPRAVSKYGNADSYRVESAKMLATTFHLLQGTPYIYQGEEIGMTNVKFTEISDYKDIETINFYYEKIEQGFSREEMMNAIWENGRDNARTPMQWGASVNAGFSSSTAWLTVNQNYADINVKQALENENSVFYYYQKLIQLRKQYPLIIHGDFKLLKEEDPNIFAYMRTYQGETLMVVSNFSEREVYFESDEVIGIDTKPEVLISNYNILYQDNTRFLLSPYEAVAFFWK
jgi:Glycosidases